MKSQILKILQMQEQGKLTQDQAAELLAVLADQARERDAASWGGGTGTTIPGNADDGGTGATGPHGAAEGGGGGTGGEAREGGRTREGSGGGPGGEGSGGGRREGSAAAALHNLVDTAVGVGTTVGRAATVWGGELLNMVHRDEGGNSVTLSKVDPPQGAAYIFRGNSLNVSTLSDLTLNQAELNSNTINASRLAHLSITRGRFSQCSISGSSLSHLIVEGALSAAVAGPEAPAAAAAGAADAGTGSAGTVASESPPAQTGLTGIRGTTFNATKFIRARFAGGSSLDACTLQAAAIKDLEFTDGSVMTDSRLNDCSLTGVHLQRAAVRSSAFDRAYIHSLTARDITLDRVTFSATRITESTFAGGMWTNTRFRRDSGGIAGVGSGRESLIQESTIDGCTLTNCDFSGCTFRRTTWRNLTLSNITVRNVDFTGMTLESEESFRKAAGLA